MFGKEFFYTIDQIENDPNLFQEIIVPLADCKNVDTFDFLRVLGGASANDYYLNPKNRGDKSELPLDIFLYDEDKTLLGGLKVNAERTGAFGMHYTFEALSE